MDIVRSSVADDDGSRRPLHTYATVSPAGIGTTTTHRVSPATIQEIMNMGDPTLINDAWDQMTVDDMTRYLESLPSPPSGIVGAVYPVGVVSPASSGFQTPSTGARTHLVHKFPLGFSQKSQYPTWTSWTWSPPTTTPPSTLPIPSLDTTPCLPTSHIEWFSGLVESSGFTTSIADVVTRSRTDGRRTTYCQHHHQ